MASGSRRKPHSRRKARLVDKITPERFKKKVELFRKSGRGELEKLITKTRKFDETTRKVNVGATPAGVHGELSGRLTRMGLALGRIGLQPGNILAQYQFGTSLMDMLSKKSLRKQLPHLADALLEQNVSKASNPLLMGATVGSGVPAGLYGEDMIRSLMYGGE